ncbi:MAG: glycoside hydrolase family 76 protein [Prevotella sp.]
MRTFILSALLHLACGAANADVTAGKAYKIAPATDTSKSIFIENASPGSATTVVIWTDTDVPAQQWEAVENDDGTFSFRNVYTDMYLARKGTLSTSTYIGLSTSASSMAKWTVTPVEGTTNRFRLYQSSSSASYAMSNSETADGSRVKLGSEDSGTNLDWEFEEVTAKKQFDNETRKEVIEAWAAKFLRDRGTYQTFGDGGGWGDAEMLETVLDAYETSGDKTYLDMFKKVFGYFTSNVGSNWLKLVYNDSYKWYGHDFNDDVMWMIIASARAYHLTGSKTYLNYAKNNFDAIYSRALNQWGMLRWAEQSGGKNGTNSCINGPAEVAACYIAAATNDETYYEKARALYENQRSYLFKPTTGEVYDSFTWDESTNLPSSYNKWVSTYNQGTMLGAALMLYKHYGDERYKQDADRIMARSRSSLCNSNGIIHVCQTVNGDLCGFKGILMRYARQYVMEMNDKDGLDWMLKNAFHAYNNRNSAGIISSAWLTKSSEDYKFGEDDFSNQPFGCSTAVSAAFNAPLSYDWLSKDAYSIIEAEDFSTLRGIYVTAGTAGDNALEVSNIANNYFTAYKRVDFGSQPATSARFRVSQVRLENWTCTIEIHIDSPDGPCIGTAVVPNSGEWQVIETTVSPISGTHDVYLVYTSSSAYSTNCFNLDWFTFGTNEQPLIGDITNNGGILTGTEDVENMEALIDGDLTTEAAAGSGTASFTYHSYAEATIKAYSIGSSVSDENAHPQSWILYGSDNGDMWTVIDEQQDGGFSGLCQNRRFNVDNDKAYRYFRIDITGKPSGSLKVSEWQLFGRCIFGNDMTAGNGTISESAEALIDKSGVTAIELNEDIVYSATGMFIPVCYSLTSNTANQAAPTDWQLIGSKDNMNWVVLDEQHGQTFACAMSSQFYRIADGLSYRYFKLVASCNGNPAKLAEWQLFGKLAANSDLVNDITDNGGEITVSDGLDKPENHCLIDNNASSTRSIPFNGNAWMSFKSTIPATVKYCVICAGNDSRKDPKSWILQGSNDGQEWNDLYTQASTTFLLRGQVRQYTVNSTTPYTYFRLVVNALSDETSNELEIGDWQLHGLCVADADLTDNGGSCSAKIDGLSTSENYDKLFDHTSATKYCFNFYSANWIEYECAQPACVNLYSITSANDESTRDPAWWTLEGSNDGTAWTTIDERKAVAFKDRQTTQFYPCDNTTEFKTYRLTFWENKGNDLGQISEWQMFHSEKIASGIRLNTVGDNGIGIGYDSARNMLLTDMPSDGNILIYATDGQLMKSVHVTAGPHSLSLHDLGRGIYVVKAHANGKAKTVKLVR